MKVSSLDHALRVACGYFHSLVLTDGSRVYAFGCNAFNALGINSPTLAEPVPTKITMLEDKAVHQLSACAFRSGCVTFHGEAFIWGMLASSDMSQHQAEPRHVEMAQKFICNISCGASHAVLFEDRLLSEALVAMRGACASGPPINVVPLISILLSIPKATELLRSIQDRALREIVVAGVALQRVMPCVTGSVAFVHFAPSRDVFSSITKAALSAAARDLSRSTSSSIISRSALPSASKLPHHHHHQAPPNAAAASLAAAAAAAAASPPSDGSGNHMATVYSETQTVVLTNQFSQAVVVTASLADPTTDRILFSVSPESRLIPKGSTATFSITCSFDYRTISKKEVPALVKFMVDKKIDGNRKERTYWYVLCYYMPPHRSESLEPWLAAMGLSSDDSDSDASDPDSTASDGSGVISLSRDDSSTDLNAIVGARRPSRRDQVEVVRALTTFVPRVLLERFKLLPMAPAAPHIQQFPASILFIDISGFTSLNERLAVLGDAGPELVSKHINAYFAQLISAVNDHGGDVLKFAGDALICMFNNDIAAYDELLCNLSRSGDERPAEELDILTLRAVGCALEIQTRLSEYDSDEGIRLTLHIGIGSGGVYSVWVGGYEGHWEYLVSGEPLAQLRTAVDASQSGEVVVSRSAWDLIARRCEGEPRGNDYYVKRIIDPVPVASVRRPMPRLEAEAALRCFIPHAVQAQIDSRQIEWMAELRVVTVLFVKLNSEFDYKQMGEYCTSINDILRCMQRVVFKYEGVVRQFLSDDKGTVLIAAFGLPPFSHRDDAIRGVLAALEIHSDLLEIKMQNTIGVTTGRVYCGCVGSDVRQEYAMVGDIVNLSARLMVAAEKLHVPILCDQATHDCCTSKVMFEALEPIMVKGKSQLINIYVPRRSGLRKRYEDDVRVVGRASEKESMRNIVFMASQRISTTTVIEGDEGIGKSNLIALLLSLARLKAVSIFVGAGEPIQQSAPFYSWAPIVSDLLGLPELIDADNREAVFATIVARLGADSKWMPYLPLLNALLPDLRIAESDFIANSTGPERRTMICDLVLFLLRQAAATAPLVLVLEDIQWMDSNSTLLAIEAVEHIKPLSLVVTTRKLATPPSPAYAKLRAHCKDLISLNLLTPAECVEIAGNALGIANLHDNEPLQSIFNNIPGNPFFVQEFALGLLESGEVVIEDGQCIISDTLNSDIHLLPTNVTAVISSRIDRLGTSAQMVLKVGTSSSSSSYGSGRRPMGR